MAFASKQVPFSGIPSFSQLFLDYISGQSALREFHAGFPDENNLKSKVKLSRFPEAKRAPLKEAFLASYKRYNLEAGEVELISSLSEPGTYTVCTGQQPGIFGGPQYVLSKIATTIRLAALYKSWFPENHFVPVYWLHNEDDDFSEINHTLVFGNEIRWEKPDGQILGSIKTDEGFFECLNQLEAIAGSSPDQKQRFLKIKDLANASQTLGEFNFRLIHFLFEGTGLLILDGAAPEFKFALNEVVRYEGGNPGKINDLVEETTQRIEKAGYQGQAKSRSVNLFRLEKNRRIEVADIKELKGPAELFSPNVITRGLFQQNLLPNLVYVGGPGEIAYWLQLKPVFDALGLDFPLILPRNFNAYTEKRFLDFVEERGLQPEVYFRPEGEGLHELFKGLTEEVDLDEAFALLGKMEKSLALKLGEIDPTLTPAAAAFKARTESQLNSLREKGIKALKNKEADTRSKFLNGRSRLMAGNVPLERIEGIISSYLRYGREGIKEIISLSRPLEFALTIYYEI
jgi:bacillithiol synthase